MDSDTTLEPEHPTIATLWARAGEWLSRWSAVFSPEEILRDGLSRRFALRCCAWLAPLEAAVRRLIIAAALALDPAQLPRPVEPVAPRQRPPSKRTTRPASFRIFSVRPSQAPRGPALPLRHHAAPQRHLSFPGDGLLRLGAPPPLRQRPPSLRPPHPLVRRGRIFPSDPDYVPRERRPKLTSSIGPRAQPEPDAAGRCFRTRLYVEASGEEWRRVEMEWQRILPAPGLAARIAVLIRVVEDPRPQVRRLARRLIADPDLVSMLRGLPAPRVRRPAYDRFGPQVDEDLVPLCHSALDPFDSS